MSYTLKISNMKFKHALLFLMFSTAISAVATEKVTLHNTTLQTVKINDDIIIYTIQAGDTSYSIARKYNITVQELYKLNPEAENGIKAGQELRIPKKEVAKISHKIEPQETMYSVSRKYGITVDDLKKANKKLDEQSFKVGKKINIPVFNGTNTIHVSDAGKDLPKNQQSIKRKEHTVLKGETLYSISKKYNTTVKALEEKNPGVTPENLKEGMLLVVEGDGATIQRPIEEINPFKQDEIIRIAILLPFEKESKFVPKSRIIETYNGFLLAVKEAKSRGQNVEVYAFDIGADDNTKKLESLLETNEIKSMSILIGGVSRKQIDIISKFARKMDVRYAIPFDTKNTVADSNPKVFRVTTSPSELYPVVARNFISKYKMDNIIFVSEPTSSDKDKKELIDLLKKELKKENIQSTTVIANDNLSANIEQAASQTKRNVLIPVSASDTSIRKIINAISNSNITNSYTFFGHPEWQLYPHLFSQLHEYNANIYSVIFLDESDAKVALLDSEYQTWYNRTIPNVYPRFAYIGYDMGIYFISAFNKLGKKFDDKITSFTAPTLQSAIRFERKNEKGGYTNAGLYFVNFKVNSTIEKKECK